MVEGGDAPTIPGIQDLHLVGRGGFASVYRGHQPAFRRDVAVKVIMRSGLATDDRRRFERECQAMGALSDHPAIVTLYDAGFTDEGRPYLVMAYVAGGTLGDRVAERGPLRWQEVIELGVRLSGALETAHRAGVLHRDIKPANVLCSTYGEQLSDFGIARIAGGHETRSGVITASVAHAAPEILDGNPPTAHADVYALGSTLYEALTGRAAFVRDTDEGLLPLIRRVVTDPPPDLRERGVPDAVATIIETAMSKTPGGRYATAEAIGMALVGAQRQLGLPTTELLVVGGLSGEFEAALPGRPDPPGEATVSPPPPTGDTVDVGGPGNAWTGPGQDASIGGPGTAKAEQGHATTGVAAGDVRNHRTPAGSPPDRNGAPPPDRLLVDDGRPPWVRATLLAAALLALLALVGGLVVLTRGDDTADPAAPEETSAPATTTAPSATDDTGTTSPPDTAPATDPPDTAPPTTPPVTVPPRPLGLVAPGVDTTHPAFAAARQAIADSGGEQVDGTAEISPADALTELVSSGLTEIVVLSSPATVVETTDALLSVAEAHPDVRFFLVGGEVTLPNVGSLSFADHEGAFLMGAAAALTTTTGRVGFLGGADVPSTEPYEAGFVDGVRHIDPTIQIDVRYLPGTGQSFADHALAATLATEMYAAGSDVIFHAATTGTGLFEAAAADPARWAIGVDTDQAATAAPAVADSILTSLVRNYDDAVYHAVLDFFDGSGDGEISIRGVADAGITYSTTGGHADPLAVDLDQLADAIGAGDIMVERAVVRRAMAPLGTACPPAGCLVRIVEARDAGGEVELVLEANWTLDTGGFHAHYFWAPQYNADQVGADSPARFGVPLGDWDLDDRYPVYVTEGAASRTVQGANTELCVTAANAGHNVVNPANFDCVPIEPPAG